MITVFITVLLESSNGGFVALNSSFMCDPGHEKRDVTSPRACRDIPRVSCKTRHFSKLIFSTPNTMAYTRLSLVAIVLFAAASPSGKQ